MKFYGETIQMKDTEQYFSVALFTMLYKVILTFEVLISLSGLLLL